MISGSATMYGRCGRKSSFEYRPSEQTKPWQQVEGFSPSTRTLERRKLNPFLDINSWTGNFASAKAQFNSGARAWLSR